MENDEHLEVDRLIDLAGDSMLRSLTRGVDVERRLQELYGMPEPDDHAEAVSARG
ncbi:hypothetical protein [Catenuloplanes atrovinosus]|uniref:Uncharacterized protein n=1 Tax=Catenuloplanes atrovinosus TaxID=137266 RepID=A0AAE3YLN5_9ACTN|nr:hypothetical protein [Catenuloplanes atrovinosus]MDR7274479.1 hypothetical protein [Catenuloplanes atrovinosus]